MPMSVAIDPTPEQADARGEDHVDAMAIDAGGEAEELAHRRREVRVRVPHDPRPVRDRRQEPRADGLGLAPVSLERDDADRVARRSERRQDLGGLVRGAVVHQHERQIRSAARETNDLGAVQARGLVEARDDERDLSGHGPGPPPGGLRRMPRSGGAHQPASGSGAPGARRVAPLVSQRVSLYG
jgi:hypothetical protein